MNSDDDWKEILDIAGMQPDSGSIVFSTAEYPNIIELKVNGDIYVKGNMIENDKELVDGLREVLKSWQSASKKSYQDSNEYGV